MSLRERLFSVQFKGAVSGESPVIYPPFGVGREKYKKALLLRTEGAAPFNKEQILEADRRIRCEFHNTFLHDDGLATEGMIARSHVDNILRNSSINPARPAIK